MTKFTADQIEYLKSRIVFLDAENVKRGFSVVGNVDGSVWGNVDGNVFGSVLGSIGGYVGGSVLGSIGGYVGGDVEGDVWGSVGKAGKPK
jgi:hypothetical protein